MINRQLFGQPASDSHRRGNARQGQEMGNKLLVASAAAGLVCHEMAVNVVRHLCLLEHNSARDVAAACSTLQSATTETHSGSKY